MQLRHFAGEKIARIANRVRAIALSLLQLCVLGLGFLQDGDVGVGVFPEGEEVLIRRVAPVLSRSTQKWVAPGEFCRDSIRWRFLRAHIIQ